MPRVPIKSIEQQEVQMLHGYRESLVQDRTARAKVAPELASKSYNSTKKMYYYGVKAHVVARQRPGSLPEIEIVVFEEAGRQDGPVFDQIRPMLSNNLVYADKAYKRPDSNVIEVSQNLKVVTPITKAPGQEHLDAAQKLQLNRLSYR